MQNLTSLSQNSSGNITLATGKTITMAGNATFTVGSIDSGSTSQLYVKGKAMVHLHDTTNGYGLEVKTNFNGTTTAHFGITSTVEYEPTGNTATAGGVQGLQGVGRLAAGKTVTGGSIIGTYGQACNLGTINGSGVMVAGLYGLVADGGTYTSASHVCSLWVDSHVTKVVGGEHELIYMTNNGTTTMDSAIYVDLSAAAKFTNLLKFSAVQTPLVANALVPAAAPDAGTVGADLAIIVDVGGTPYYIPMYNTLHA